MKMSTQDIIAKFLQEFDRVQAQVQEASELERLRFGASVRGAWHKARKHLKESLDFTELSKNSKDKARATRLNSTEE